MDIIEDFMQRVGHHRHLRNCCFLTGNEADAKLIQICWLNENKIIFNEDEHNESTNSEDEYDNFIGGFCCLFNFIRAREHPFKPIRIKYTVKKKKK